MVRRQTGLAQLLHPANELIHQPGGVSRRREQCDCFPERGAGERGGKILPRPINQVMGFVNQQQIGAAVIEKPMQAGLRMEGMVIVTDDPVAPQRGVEL